MGFLGSFVKTGVKLGTIGGLVFVAHDQKILSNAEDGEKVFTELKTLFNENSDLPDTQFIRENIPDLSISASKWNKGVATTFDGIRNSPSTISYYAVQGKDFVVSSLDGLNATEDKSEDKQ
ncbi:uncharacterized protein [Lepeophtheirus salmonis]|uniref:uncharacterized protein n=1 Tax=Lepeophtheirus salmonis TaxID=72036 RepID=UPI001AE40DBF|nr:uncharacterized protein LOC121117595 [Lepeophtheirus salmonis]